ncbi:hypothetical protein HW132_10995 [Brasilonema sp. CT11]|nr:hypothetical protein [Brasilonema sp. CT11]
MAKSYPIKAVEPVASADYIEFLSVLILKMGGSTNKTQQITQGVFTVKKSYEAPKLNNYGTVAKMTEYFGISSTDTLYGPTGAPAGNSTGTINACATANQQNCLPK